MVFDRVPRRSRGSGRVRAAGPVLAEGCRRVTKSPSQSCQAEKSILLRCSSLGLGWSGSQLDPVPGDNGAMSGPIETLVIHPGALGDVLQAAPALSALERGGHRLTF